MDAFVLNALQRNLGDLSRIAHLIKRVCEQAVETKKPLPSEMTSLLTEMIGFMRKALETIDANPDPALPAMPGLTSLLEDIAKGSSFPLPDYRAEWKELGSETPGGKNTEEEPRSQEDTARQVGAEEVGAEDAEESEDEGNGAGEAVAAAQDDRSGKSDPPKAAAKAAPPATSPDGGSDTVRIKVDKLDSLMNLIEELVITETMVTQSPLLRKLDTSFLDFKKSLTQLEKISRDIQGVATSLRMIPLAGTFRKMIRLVRDVSRKTNKQVELEIIGEHTEIDKSMIELIYDPLVHLVRNGIDHGVEPPEERKRLGKSETGKVTLEAKYVNREVWIQIRDDGRGLDRNKLLAAAEKKGILRPGDHDAPDEEIFQIIFRPGFSTAEKLTDVSGRGVGMDVVKRNIERIRGRIDVQSTLGKGTTITLRIPLTLAIIDGMIVRLGKTDYTIPLLVIKETLRPTEDMVNTTPDGTEVITIRDNLLPVLRLNELLFGRDRDKPLQEGILVIVERDDRNICLFVDEVVGKHQIVIKGLSPYLGEVDYISGCTILADGEVSPILDVDALVQLNFELAQDAKLGEAE